MYNFAGTIINTVLIVVCIVIAVVFVTIPLPKNDRLKLYRISLKSLSVAYFIMAVLTVLILFFNAVMADVVPIVGLIISTLQALLFFSSLTVLINPRRITSLFLVKFLIVIFTFTILLTISKAIYGNIELPDIAAIRNNISNPTVLLRVLFLLFYLFQLVYLSIIFFRDFRSYQLNVNNYYADTQNVSLIWVRNSFIISLLIGISAFFSLLFFDPFKDLIFTSVHALFYFVFGLFYIQYPDYFPEIEFIIYESNSKSEETKKNMRTDWNELREKVISNKYYLRQSVNIEDMAKLLGVGRTTLSVHINKHEKVNFNTWINVLRISEAKNLLIKNPEFTLSELAEKVGYTEPSNFSRQFKQIVQESPSVWRQKMNQNIDKPHHT